MDSFPGVFAKLPVKAISAIDQADLSNLSTIYLGEVEAVPQMNNVHETIQVKPAWNSGYTGVGVRLGIMDTGVVDGFSLHPAFTGKTITIPDVYRNENHAARVSAIMFGNDPLHPEYRGIAYGNTELVSVEMDVEIGWPSINTGLNQLVDGDAFVIVVSLKVNMIFVGQIAVSGILGIHMQTAVNEFVQQFAGTRTLLELLTLLAQTSFQQTWI